MIILLKFWRELAICVLVTVLYFLIAWVGHLRSDLTRQSNNVNVLTTNVKFFKTKAGQNASQVMALNYTLSDLKAHEPQLIQVIKSADIKPKNVISVSEVAINNAVKFKVKDTDSIKRLPLFADTLKCFHYADNYNRIIGCTYKDSTECQVFNLDTIVNFPSIDYKHNWLFGWQWGVKGIKMTTVNSNPNTQITYSKYIQMN